MSCYHITHDKYDYDIVLLSQQNKCTGLPQNVSVARPERTSNLNQWRLQSINIINIIKVHIVWECKWTDKIMSRIATKIKSIFSFNSDSYHVHKATEEELLSSSAQFQPPPPIVVLRAAPKPPESRSVPGGGVSMIGGGVSITNNNMNSNQSIALKAVPDKKQSRQRKVSLVWELGHK